MKGAALGVAGVAALLAMLVEPTAQARSQQDLPWSPKEVFPVALRFVRVDRNCKIVDRDEAAGFIVFDCVDEAGVKGAPLKHGALEIIPMESSSRGGVRVQVTLTNEPRYLELRFLELLERKLREERGAVTPGRAARGGGSAAVPDGGS